MPWRTIEEIKGGSILVCKASGDTWQGTCQPTQDGADAVPASAPSCVSWLQGIIHQCCVFWPCSLLHLRFASGFASGRSSTAQYYRSKSPRHSHVFTKAIWICLFYYGGGSIAGHRSGLYYLQEKICQKSNGHHPVNDACAKDRQMKTMVVSYFTMFNAHGNETPCLSGTALFKRAINDIDLYTIVHNSYQCYYISNSSFLPFSNAGWTHAVGIEIWLIFALLIR